MTHRGGLFRWWAKWTATAVAISIVGLWLFTCLWAFGVLWTKSPTRIVTIEVDSGQFHIDWLDGPLVIPPSEPRVRWFFQRSRFRNGPGSASLLPRCTPVPGTSTSSTGFGIEFSLLLVLAGVPAALLWLPDFLKPGRGRCPRCGYDLAGLAPGAACPECGKAHSAH